MKGISKTTHAGLGPLIPAVLAPPEVLAQAPQGFIPPPLNPTGARLETKERAWWRREAERTSPSVHA